MNYYAVPIEKTPTMLFAHRYKTSDKAWQLSLRERVIEISYIHSGDIELVGPSGRMRMPQGSIACISHGIPMTIYNHGGQHVHYTVAMEVEEIVPTEERTDPLLAYLPILLTPDMGSAVSVISEDIVALVNTLPDDRVKAAARLLRLLSHMNDAARGAEQGKNPLCYRVKRYVEQHIDADLSPNEIAADLGVSYGHLSRIFKAQEGMTLVRYITRARLGYVRELLMLRRMTLEEAGLAAGFTDVKYLSRCFHREYDITAREYIRSLNE